MKKFFGILLVIFIVIGAYYWSIRGQLISSFLSEKLGAQIQIDRFSITPWSIKFYTISAYEPTTDSTLTVDQITVNTPITYYFYKVIEINKLELTNVKMQSALGGVKIDSIESITKFAKDLFGKISQKKEAPLSPPPSEKEFIIHHFIARNVEFQIQNPLSKNGKPLEAKVSTIELNELNKGKAIFAKQLLDKIIQTLSNAYPNL